MDFIARFRFLSAILSALTILVLFLVECSPAQETSVELPTDPSVWLNSPPITSPMLKGKGAVLYFFEEG